MPGMGFGTCRQIQGRVQLWKTFEQVKLLALRRNTVSWRHNNRRYRFDDIGEERALLADAWERASTLSHAPPDFSFGTLSSPLTQEQ